jgi:hypothetical protein
MGREEEDNQRRSDGGGSEFSDVLEVDADAAAEDDEDIVDLEDVVVASDGGFVEDDADADLDAVRGGCNGKESVEEGRLSRPNWWKDRSTSLSRSTSRALSCSFVCWIVIASCDPHLSNCDGVLEGEARSK